MTMQLLRSWWRRLTGRSGARPATPARIRSSKTPDADPGLTLADDPPPGRRSSTGAAGFDPYSSDAGFAKPHSWERIDHD